jgi:hypothetical protein
MEGETGVRNDKYKKRTHSGIMGGNKCQNIPL